MKKTQEKLTNGITLIALIITIIVLLILAGVTIVTLTGENGLLGKASTAAQNTDRKSAEEKIQIKMQECYVENKGKPTLQQFADYLCDDDEVEYVSTKKKVASIAHIEVGEAEKIYVKLKEYNYEIEISDNIEIGTVKEITGKPKESKETDAGTTHMTGDTWTATVPTDDWLSNEEYYSTDWAGEGTEEKPYLIQIEEDLAGLSYNTKNGENYQNKYFKLTSDLSVGKHIWCPISGFKGNFDGDNHKISGIYINNSSTENLGLFGDASGTDSNNKSIIKNIKIKDSLISGNADNYRTQYVGGVVGNATYLIIENCYNYAYVCNGMYIGGIVRRSLYWCYKFVW